MSSDIFNVSRFLNYGRHYWILHNRLFIVAMIAYMGLMFVVLNFVQLTEYKGQLDANAFVILGMISVGIYGLLILGHAFPAFRSKERSIDYLLIPASAFEKYLFEIISRWIVIIILLPVLFWVTFHFQGLFAHLFSGDSFEFIHLQNFTQIEVVEDAIGMNPRILGIVSVFCASLLVLIFSFAGTTTFTKQPLVKTLFSMATLLFGFWIYAFVIMTYTPAANRNLPENTWITPSNATEANLTMIIICLLASVVMLFVSYRKIIEKEV